MPLFDPKTSWLPLNEPEANVVTPLGTLAFRTLVDGEPQSPVEVLTLRKGIELRRYTHSTIDLELLLAPVTPIIPAHRHVDGCVAAVWRLRAKQPSAPITLRAEWKQGAVISDVDPGGGEHLTALTWEGPNCRVSLGTSDEEGLAFAAYHGFLPARFVPIFEPDLASNVNLRQDYRGLEIALPGFQVEETAQVHMILAWITDPEEEDISPWFAVDMWPKDITARIRELLQESAAVDASQSRC